MAVTTIQLRDKTKNSLASLKMYPRETYDEVIERLLEDLKELNEGTKRELENARREIDSGKFITHEKLKEKLGF